MREKHMMMNTTRHCSFRAYNIRKTKTTNVVHHFGSRRQHNKKNHHDDRNIRHRGFTTCNTKRNPRWQTQFIILVLRNYTIKKTMTMNIAFIILVS